MIFVPNTASYLCYSGALQRRFEEPWSSYTLNTLRVSNTEQQDMTSGFTAPKQLSVSILPAPPPQLGSTSINAPPAPTVRYVDSRGRESREERKRARASPWHFLTQLFFAPELFFFLLLSARELGYGIDRPAPLSGHFLRVTFAVFGYLSETKHHQRSISSA